MDGKRKAVVLLSGGIDSTTVAAIARQEGFEVCAMTFKYGQRHAAELDAARRVVEALGVRRRVVMEIGLEAIGGSALTSDIEVPRDRRPGAEGSEIPVTYVPARNTIFLSFALAWAEVLQASDIFIGVNAIDYSGYPDCRPEYLEAFQRMADLATKAGVEGALRIRIRAPLIHMTKSEIIQTGVKLGVDYGLTHSCYDPAPDGRACGRCDSCQIRKSGFAEAGIEDPTKYING
ncbi:MAG: 7-cyano-7-deazaguanine synthase QueC [Deltaproteobacteria bacterium]|nr:7-cyano-7-deazaguanine synthase QueC [Deltaproteobacteria bacterium]